MNNGDFTTKELEGVGLDRVTYSEIEDSMEEMLSEGYPPFKIGELTYDAGRVLKEIDPIAFREIVLQEINSKFEDDILFESSDGDYFNFDEVQEYSDNLNDKRSA